VGSFNDKLNEYFILIYRDLKYKESTIGCQIGNKNKFKEREVKNKKLN
jgi:hypothetical protein